MKTTKFFALLPALIAGVFIFESCSKSESYVTTSDASEITATSAKLGGVTHGFNQVRGVQYAENPSLNPSFSDNLQEGGEGAFEITIIMLNPSTKYYYRAYMADHWSTEVIYGEVKSFTTAEAPGYPILTTMSVVAITTNSATCGGIILSGENISAKGVCWNTSSFPTIADDHTNDGSGLESFVSSITGLTANTKYFVRAYAINSLDTGYGGVQNFTTLGK